jgi:hypothetical protein
MNIWHDGRLVGRHASHYGRKLACRAGKKKKKKKKSGFALVQCHGMRTITFFIARFHISFLIDIYLLCFEFRSL